MKKYQVVVKYKEDDLEKWVQEMMNAGWELQGGVSCSIAVLTKDNGHFLEKSEYTLFSQAMVKEE